MLGAHLNARPSLPSRWGQGDLREEVGAPRRGVEPRTANTIELRRRSQGAKARKAEVLILGYLGSTGVRALVPLGHSRASLSLSRVAYMSRTMEYLISASSRDAVPASLSV
jgi:hypothetical protein